MAPTDDAVHLFYVHSPITYSMALATIAHLQLANVRLIGARGIAGGAWISQVVDDDGGIGIERTCQFMSDLLALCPAKCAIVLYLPHSVFLFGQLARLSGRVRQIYYLEEGYTSAHLPLLQATLPPLLERTDILLATLEQSGLMARWQLERPTVALLDQTPYRAFDACSAKYAGGFACSADAFRGLPHVIQLPLPVNPQRHDARLLSFGSVLNRLGAKPDHAVLNQLCEQLLAAAQRMLDQPGKQRTLLLKLHPRDGQGLPSWFYRQWQALGADYITYCQSHNLDPNSEPALHNLDHYHVVGTSAQSKYVTQLLGRERLSSHDTASLTGT